MCFSSVCSWIGYPLSSCSLNPLRLRITGIDLLDLSPYIAISYVIQRCHIAREGDNIFTRMYSKFSK